MTTSHHPLFSRTERSRRIVHLLCAVVLWAGAATARAESMLQYFNTSWTEITAKMPELAEAGYTSLWLPPPTKGSGGLSVGYDLWDPFDLGSKNQRGSVKTRYGTEAELLTLVETAHRFGIRVYFDNIMNHRAFDVPGYNENTPIDTYPGLVPEDFHLRLTQDGFYRKWDNTRDWNSAWQVQNLGLADLIDIAQEPGPTNLNFGASEGATGPKIKFIRDLDRPENYYTDKDGNYIGFGGLLAMARQPGNLGPGAGDSAARAWAQVYLQTNASVYEERVEDYLNRSARWLMDRTKADGLRLDAVKHVRADFFGATYGADKDSNDYGYLGQVQRQFNISRGYSDSNHRDSVFNTETGRDDAMAFGEHLGEPPGYQPYIDAGMRLVDNPLRNEFNNRLGSPWNGLNGFDSPGAGGFSPSTGVMHAQSHDSDYAARRELQHAMYFTRAGIGLLYTDGNYQAETLGESGGAFPRHANTAFLGQWNDPRVPNLLYIHDQFARGEQSGRYSDGDVVVYERIDKRENGGMSDADGATLLFMLNDNYSAGGGRTFSTSFSSGDYLYNYSTYGGGFFKYAWEISNGSTLVPPGGYFAFSWKNPDPSKPWSDVGGKPIEILQGGVSTGTVTVERRDGPNGDASFNPNNLPNRGYPAGVTPKPYTYMTTMPRVTDATALRFVARTDGSTRDTRFKLDGGVDLNGTRPGGITDPGYRDCPPGVSTDTFLGYESAEFVQRIHPELFAAVDTGARNVTGSTGAETYTSAGMLNPGGGTKVVDGDTATYIYHDPEAAVEDRAFTQYGDGGRIYAKSNSGLSGYKVFLYYTDATAYPEGAGGMPVGSTKAIEMNWSHDAGGGSWWKTNNPMPGDFVPGVSRYKIGIFKTMPLATTWWPGSYAAVERKKKMLSVFQTPERNLAATTVYPHNDYGVTRTGLAEGMHVIRARAYLDRGGKASIYNTFVQPFYYDAMRPDGQIVYPGGNGDTVGGSEYGLAVRTDASVTEVWFNVADNDANNDDVATKQLNGNGGGFEPFTDSDRDGTRDEGEAFDDLDGDGIWDASLPTSWVRATEVTPSGGISPANPAHTKEWRFTYTNIPSSGTAVIKVRLREISSAAYKDFGLGDVAGHYTTLERSVETRGPDYRMFIAWPSADGETVGTDYQMKVHFSQDLAAGLSDEQIKERFLVAVGPNEPGAAGTPLGRASFVVNRGITGSLHELACDLPNLYNDQPDYLHKITVTFDPAGSIPDYIAARVVKAYPSSAPRISIVNPPELGSDGKPYVIVLPKLASPTPEDRQSIVRVSTSTNVVGVAMSFDFGSGSIALASPGEFVLSGSLGLTDGSPVVAGTGTKFTEEISAGNLIKVNGVTYTVAAVASPESLTLAGNAVGTFAGSGTRVDPNPRVEGTQKIWDYKWTGMTAGDFRLKALVTDPASTPPDDPVADYRNVTVVFRENVADDPDDADDDDDGLLDIDENTPRVLPNQSPDGGTTPPAKPNPETWLNGDVHVYYAYGHSLPTSPDSDGDGLPDGLEVGWRTSSNPPTITATDTDGDGFPNFIGDLDPPFYNTLDNLNNVPGVNSASEGGDRAKRLAGTTTDPANPDSDNDGIKDGIEDANRNGWVDGDGASLPTDWNPFLARDWPNSVIDPGETWTETSPTLADTDKDGLSDGHGEDKDYNGLVAGDADNDRAYDGGEEWSETNPLKADTDGDGLPDGWEVNNGLDPLDNGTDNWRTAASGDGSPDNGATGDPDLDSISNGDEFANGTDPHRNDNLPPPPANSIVIGPGTAEVVGDVTNFHEFDGWTRDDLVMLDAYDGNGGNNQGGDVYHAGDGFDSSRDLVAFYAHDGGGDDRVYFRADVQDLAAYAEEGNLDLYVVIDTGNPSSGESNLPDDIDTRTEMKWEAVVAVYSTDNGAVYVDTQRGEGNNSTAIGQDLAGFGVERRDGAHPHGFKKSYFNSELDAVEFSISRQALVAAGWTGDWNTLNFQVFTTRDGTRNSPRGLGDIGGRSDIRDSIGDDWIASDYWRDQGNISGDKSVLYAWFGRSAMNDRGKRAKVISLVHETRAIDAASEIFPMINTGAGAGYYRVIDTHDAFGVPVAMHVTPTLASAIQWAKVNPALVPAKPWRDGPALNSRIAGLRQDGIVNLLGTTFSDHLLPYFSKAFNTDNVMLADQFTAGIYGSLPSRQVFYTPERVLDADVLDKVDALGFNFTLVDQTRHIQKWFGRASALGDAGYRINEINGVKTIVINEGISDFRFTNHDGGLPMPMRELLNRKASSGEQHQVVTLYSDWSDFTTKSKADAYDKNVRWLAARPWIQVVTPDQIANAEIDLSVPPDGTGDIWASVNRGTGLSLQKVGKDWIDHATQENYDNWYNGQAGREEGLAGKVFEVRTGTNLPAAYGMQVINTGIAGQSWGSLAGLPGPTDGFGGLASGTMHSSVFLTAFHNQSANDLSKFSTGAYIYPDTSNQQLAGFAKAAQSQTRFTAVFARVQAWADAPPASATTVIQDVDLDGEMEYLLYNKNLFAVFERSGGRMTGAWTRDPSTGGVFQVIGNFLSYSGSETEDEGDTHNTGAAINARRTSGFKDWFAVNGGLYTNNYYAVAPSPSGTGWTFTSADGKIAKTLTLENTASQLRAQYVLAGGATTLYTRFGFSPDLRDLLTAGQANLAPLANSGGHVRLTNLASNVSVFLQTSGNGLAGTTYNPAAIDTAPGTFSSDAINMRNQAQTHQIEIQGGTSFSFALGFETNGTDADGDTLPDWWERANNLSPDDNGSVNPDNGPTGNPDGDGMNNQAEFVFGKNPRAGDIYQAQVAKVPAGYAISFPTIPDRVYRVLYSNNLGGWSAFAGPITGDGTIKSVIDDGTATTPAPAVQPRRFYTIEVQIAPP